MNYYLFLKSLKHRNTGSKTDFQNPLVNICFALLITVSLALTPVPKASASMAEHQAVLDLVPLTAVSRRVVNDGLWSEPSTWNGSTLPQAGENIHVPADKTLIADVESNLSFKTLRVDGKLEFSAVNNVTLKLDTLVVTHQGTIEIGSELERIPAANTIKIIIANNGPIDREWDPMNISRGVILQGKTRIFGAEKSAYHKLAVNPASGSYEIELEAAPNGWTVGDTVVITATRFRKKEKTDTSYITQDEMRSIQAINGRIVTLGKPGEPTILASLNFNHASGSENIPVYAANLSRNVRIMGEGGDAIPNAQRGHFVVMHSPDTVIKGAGFYSLGRTDKSYPLNDFKLDSQGYRLKDAKENYINDINTNPRGRYAVHFHHTGTNINVPPVICSGNAIISSPGWGFVNHSSNVIMENNASYNVFGSHFVTEDGNELGSFKHNIAIKSEGRDTIVKTGLGNHDHGHTGHGFWMQTRNMTVEDNVISGVYDSAVVFYHRLALPEINVDIPRQNLLTPFKSIAKGWPTIEFSRVPITAFRNTTVLASGSALDVIKEKKEQYHDVRNLIESLKGYSIMGGLQLQYTEKYTFSDLELIADPATKQWNKGVNIFKKDRDIAFVNAKINGFIHPFVTGTTFNGEPDKTDATFFKTLVDGRPIIPEIDIHTPDNQTVSNYDPDIHKVIDELAVTDGSIPVLRLKRTIPGNIFDLTLGEQSYIFNGVKFDSLGESFFETEWKNDNLIALLHAGYYSLPDGRKCILLRDVISDRFNGQPKTVVTKLILTRDYKLMGPELGVLKY